MFPSITVLFFTRSGENTVDIRKGIIDASDLSNAVVRRLYVTQAERNAFIEVARWVDRDVRTFCLALAYTSCHISKALALTGQSIDFSNQAVVIETLKKRKKGIFRAVPVPLAFLETMDSRSPTQATEKIAKSAVVGVFQNYCLATFAFSHAAGPYPRWPSPVPSWDFDRILESLLLPMSGVPRMGCRWRAHANLEVTAIVTNALGKEQRQLASKMWS